VGKNVESQFFERQGWNEDLPPSIKFRPAQFSAPAVLENRSP